MVVRVGDAVVVVVGSAVVVGVGDAVVVMGRVVLVGGVVVVGTEGEVVGGRGVVVDRGVVVVVLGGGVVGSADGTVLVDGGADTVTVLGSAVTVAVGGTVTVTVEVGPGGSGACAVGGLWIERLTVAEKLALIDMPVEVSVGLSVGTGVVSSVAVAVFVGSTVDWDVSVLAISLEAGASAGSVASPGDGPSAGTGAPTGGGSSPGAATSPGGNSAPGSSAGAVGSAAAGSTGAVGNSESWTGTPENVSVPFARDGGLVSAPTRIASPIAVVTRAAVTPARDSCRGKRPDAGSSLLSTVRIQTPAFSRELWRPWAGRSQGLG
ncbi:hypothetical protein [Nocardia neocaledoniensis]|uniref:hypothetical protein n=1 Tax=Nocardia neocaledoniensis TaxID=236511 RepID=UPI002456DE01|nr:hypothetical protein [Nocardia neocaledoniensis]